MTGCRARLKTWAGDRRGATAVVFALAIAVLAPLSLGVLDIYVASEQRGKLQDALDAAALYAARSSAQTDADIDAIGDKVLAANLSLIPGATLQTSDFRLSGSKVVADASVQLQAFSPMMAGEGPVQVNSEVQRSMDRLEVALVLDNTWSMNGTKITTLRTEAKNLVDKLAAAAARSTEPTPIKISLVPFSSTVRVLGDTSLGAYNTSTHTGSTVPNWIDARGRAHGQLGLGYEIFATTNTDRFQMMKAINVNTWSGCVEARRPPYDVQEDAPGSDVKTLFTPFFWPDEPDSGTSGAGTNGNNNNYLTDKTSSSTFLTREQYVQKYTSSPVWQSGTTFNYLGKTISRGPNAGCILQPVKRLTTDTASIKTAIDGMTPVGETNIPLGLMWGWHTLTPNAPFADGQAYNTLHLRKIVILMTDGENTQLDSGSDNDSYYGGLGYIWQRMLSTSSNPSTSARTTLINNRLSQLCTNMKAKKIEIYTIRVEVTSGSSSLLQGCATTPDKFYDVTDVSKLGAAFDAIAGAITNLRISH
jgi:Flp pilus assembly protein TadG